jgi:hypothetical protein
MPTKSTFTTTLSFFAIVNLLSFLLVYSPASAQDEREMPMNYAGITTLVDAANMSVSAGLEYERVLYSKDRFAVTGRGNWFKTYRSGNADLSISGYVSGYGNRYDISLLQCFGTAYLFTSRSNNNLGFFLSAGGGATFSHAKKRTESSYGADRYSDVLKGAEGGMGFVSAFSGTNTLRFMFTLSLSDPQETPEGKATGSPMVLGMAKLSIGF